MSMRVKLALLLSIAVVLALLLGFASLSLEAAYRGSRCWSLGSPSEGEERPVVATTRGREFMVVPLLGLISIWILATLVCAVLAVVLVVALKVYEKRRPPVP